MVARGVIARTIERLQDDDDRRPHRHRLRLLQRRHRRAEPRAGSTSPASRPPAVRQPPDDARQARPDARQASASTVTQAGQPRLVHAGDLVRHGLADRQGRGASAALPAPRTTYSSSGDGWTRPRCAAARRAACIATTGSRHRSTGCDRRARRRHRPAIVSGVPARARPRRPAATSSTRLVDEIGRHARLTRDAAGSASRDSSARCAARWPGQRRHARARPRHPRRVPAVPAPARSETRRGRRARPPPVRPRRRPGAAPVGDAVQAVHLRRGGAAGDDHYRDFLRDPRASSPATTTCSRRGRTKLCEPTGRRRRRRGDPRRRQRHGCATCCCRS